MFDGKSINAITKNALKKYHFKKNWEGDSDDDHFNDNNTESESEYDEYEFYFDQVVDNFSEKHLLKRHPIH